jgi:hypothetical protein
MVLTIIAARPELLCTVLTRHFLFDFLHHGEPILSKLCLFFSAETALGWPLLCSSTSVT